MQKIIDAAIPVILGLVLKALKPAQIEAFADRALDWREAAIAKSETKYDDELVIPLIALVREAFSIEDNDAAPAVK